MFKKGLQEFQPCDLWKSDLPPQPKQIKSFSRLDDGWGFKLYRIYLKSIGEEAIFEIKTKTPSCWFNYGGFCLGFSWQNRTLGWTKSSMKTNKKLVREKFNSEALELCDKARRGFMLWRNESFFWAFLYKSFSIERSWRVVHHWLTLEWTSLTSRI